MKTNTSVSRMLTCFCMQNELLVLYKTEIWQWLLTRNLCLMDFYFLPHLNHTEDDTVKLFEVAYPGLFLSYEVPNINILHLLPIFYKLASFIYWCASFFFS